MAPNGMQDNTWFIPGYGISRQILFGQLRLYLGQYATARPFNYRGREGYIVTAPGPGLTRVSLPALLHVCQARAGSPAAALASSLGAVAGGVVLPSVNPTVWRTALIRPKNQIEDLKMLSRQYEEQLANKMVGAPDVNAPVPFSANVGRGGAGGSGGGSGQGSYGYDYDALYGGGNGYESGYSNGYSTGYSSSGSHRR